jgi:hypothetical protein
MSLMDILRKTEGCNINLYHVTALHNAGDCDNCFKLLGRAFMKMFTVTDHEDFGRID